MTPLVTERLVCNIAVLRYRDTNVTLQSWYIIRKLECNASNELSSVANISTASREEEAGSEPLLLKVIPSNDTNNYRLPRTGQAV